MNDGGLDMAEELRSVLRWEEKRMGAVSRGVLKSVIARLDALHDAATSVKSQDVAQVNAGRPVTDWEGG